MGEVYALFLSRIQWAYCADIEETEWSAPLLPPLISASVLQGESQKRARPCHFWPLQPRRYPVWFLETDCYQFPLQLRFRTWVVPLAVRFLESRVLPTSPIRRDLAPRLNQKLFCAAILASFCCSEERGGVSEESRTRAAFAKVFNRSTRPDCLSIFWIEAAADDTDLIFLNVTEVKAKVKTDLGLDR